MQPENLQIDISLRTLMRVLMAVLLVFLVLRLFPILTLLFFSVLVAVALEPVLRFLERFMHRRFGVFLIALFLATLLTLFVFGVVPPLIEQTQKVIEKIPIFIHWMMEGQSPRSLIHRLGSRILGGETVPDLSSSFSQLLTLGQFAVGSLSSLGLFFAFTVYLMLDGRRTFLWLMPYFSPQTRLKVEDTLQEMGRILPAYVLGQTLVCLTCGIYVFSLLTILKVPSALMLATLAAAFAVLPIIGFYISLVPVLVFSLITSVETAALVLLFFGLYHLFEGYVLLPVIYSQHLRLSGFMVLLSIVVGMSLMGIIGAIALLPLAAAYPTIERIWLAPYLRKEVIPLHSQMQSEKSPPPTL